MEPILSLSTAKDIAGHLAKWLVNLGRAKEKRKHESLRAVDKVVSLTRRSMVYGRALKAGHRDFKIEADLAASWSDLAGTLRELKLEALAKKCDLLSRHTADPEQFSAQFLADADLSFASIEALARRTAVGIKTSSLAGG